MKKLEKKQLIVVAFTFALLLLIGGTYAYFSINATSDKTGAKVTGKANNLGNPTMQIKTSKLYLNLNASLMSQANAGKTYYANENENGLALTTNPNYTLSTASLTEGDEALDCTYNYKVTATVTTAITDNSDSDVKVIVGDKEMTLKELTTAGTTGIMVSGEIKNLTKGQSVSISLTSSVTNTANTQDNLVGNSYTINIEPYNNGDTKAFSCKLHESGPVLAQYLINTGNLWQSGLEGDGYRYIGQTAICSYDNDNYIMVAENQGSTLTCPTLYNYTNSNGVAYNYETSCPSDYSCTSLEATIRESSLPQNFICFGTTDKTECTTSQDKYMYRVLGVFSDTNGDSHVKLIKYKELESFWWHQDDDADISWENSNLYNWLNGGHFLTNETYIPNVEWSNKIESWIWSAVNTQTNSNHGPDYADITAEQIYLHEMNRSTKSNTVGEWTTPSAKIGLMYTSDYALSLGPSTLSLSPSYYNRNLFKTGWVHLSNNDKENYEWTMARFGDVGGYHAYTITYDGYIWEDGVDGLRGVRPVFYLTTDTKVSSGDGSLENPFIIEN